MRQWTTLHKYMWLRILQGANAVYETVKGAIISFVTKKSAPLTELKVEFSPVQDLHGYANPWPAGGGKNLWDEQYTGIQESATLVYRAIAVGDGQFTLSTDCPKYTTAAELFLLAGNVDSGASTDTNGVSDGIPRTVTSSGGYVTIAYRAQGGVNPQNYHTQLESGSTPTAYTPYENVCPISGWTWFNVSQVGKNLFPSTDRWYNSRRYSGGGGAIIAQILNDTDVTIPTSVSQVQYGWCKVIPCKAGQTYTFKYHGNKSYRMCIAEYATLADAHDYTKAVASANSNSDNTVTITAEQDDLILCAILSHANDDLATLDGNEEIQVELGTTASDYQPFNPASRSIPITFPAIGANQWDEQYFQAKKNMNASGEVAYNAEHAVLGTMEHKIPVKPNTEYRIIAPSGGSYACFYDANGNFISPRKYTNTGLITAYENAAYMLIGVPYTEDTYGNDLGINYPSSVTTYEPYTNTVYGGYANLTLGKLVATYIRTGGTRYYAAGTRTGGYYVRTETKDYFLHKGVGNYYYCNIAESLKYNPSEVTVLGITPMGNSGDNIHTFHTWIPEQLIHYQTGDDLLADISRDLPLANWEFVVELATPIEFDLTPEQINALKGDNTMWANTNGDIEAKYRSN